ncbi:MAG: hypothetical protein KJO44_03975, partial [Gemmatimonadetes bacterium]|nr:hypothetical protein [Gemmatimonadota bacterium]
YWTNQYGNRARMLGGSVIGSVSDISAVYYNPGRLATNPTAGLILAGNVFQATRVTRENALGPGQDLSSTKYDALPALFAGEFTLGFMGKSRLAYSLLTRQNFDISVSARGSLDDVFGTPGLETGAEVRFDQNLGETWGGLSWAWPLSDRFGIGVTWFGALRSQSAREQSVALAVNESDRAGIVLQGLQFDFTDLRFLWKLGFGADLDEWQLGISLTTPGVHIAGSGTITVDEVVLDQDLNDDGEFVTLLRNDQQEGLPTLYKSPLSIGGGASYEFGATTLHGSVEWFDGLGEWTVIEAEPVEPQVGEGPIVPSVTDDLGSVFNWALGLQHDFPENFGGYIGFRTDRSAANEASLSNSTLSFWDLYHVSGGATFTVGRSSFTMGLIYSFGNDIAKPLRLTPQTLGSPGSDDYVRFRRITFIIGFELSFAGTSGTSD